MMYTTSAAPRARRAVIQKLATLIVSAAFVTITACGGDSPTAPNEENPTPKPNTNPTGTYVLRTVDGDKLPVEVYHGPYFDAPNQRFYNQYVVQVTDGEIELLKGNTWRITLNFKYTADGKPGGGSFTSNGSYEIDGGNIALNGADEGMPGFEGTFSRGAIGLDLEYGNNKRVLTYSFQK